MAPYSGHDALLLAALDEVERYDFCVIQLIHETVPSSRECDKRIDMKLMQAIAGFLFA